MMSKVKIVVRRVKYFVSAVMVTEATITIYIDNTKRGYYNLMDRKLWDCYPVDYQCCSSYEFIYAPRQ